MCVMGCDIIIVVLLQCVCLSERVLFKPEKCNSIKEKIMKSSDQQRNGDDEAANRAQSLLTFF